MNLSAWVKILVLPLAVLLNLALPNAANRPAQPKDVLNGIVLLTFAAASTYVLFASSRGKDAARVLNLAGIFGSFILLWVLIVGKLGMLNPHSFPSPNNVFHVLWSERDFLTYESSAVSLTRVFIGYFAALALGVVLGFAAGRNERVFSVAYPAAKVTAVVPPVVYLPYSIAVLPTIEAAVVFVIFIGAFWPIFLNTMFGVRNVERSYVELAKTLGAKDDMILKHVIFPASMPSILGGALLGLILAFVMLTAGEMATGVPTGLGFYLLYSNNVGYFDRVQATILIIAFWVFFWVTLVFDAVQLRVLRWQTPKHSF